MVTLFRIPVQISVYLRLVDTSPVLAELQFQITFSRLSFIMHEVHESAIR